MSPGAVKLPLNDSHVAPGETIYATANDGPPVVKWTVCDGAGEPCSCPVNDSEAGAAVKFALVVTVSVTGTSNGLLPAPAEDSEIVPA
jgi:hypothetical protein